MRGPTIDDPQTAPMEAISAGVVGLRLFVVNVFGLEGRDGWVLVDAGLAGSSDRISRWAAEQFGGPPRSVVLTHAHFDHVGALQALVDEWQIPVYAHELELPYLTGVLAYPEPDPSVGGGLMARLCSLYPRGPVEIHPQPLALPLDGTVPEVRGWRWIHTPGHTVGHVSLFREADRTLVVGDAFCTTRQESLRAVATERPELNGPPTYFTTDWTAARATVERLADLEPDHVAPGHGRPMSGQQIAPALHQLAAAFDEVARPAGR